MMIVVLRNSFHEREVRVRVRSLPHTLSPSQTARVRRELCGHHDCKCGVIRGPQKVGLYPDGNREGRLTWTITELRK